MSSASRADRIRSVSWRATRASSRACLGLGSSRIGTLFSLGLSFFGANLILYRLLGGFIGRGGTQIGRLGVHRRRGRFLPSLQSFVLGNFGAPLGLFDLRTEIGDVLLECGDPIPNEVGADRQHREADR